MKTSLSTLVVLLSVSLLTSGCGGKKEASPDASELEGVWEAPCRHVADEAGKQVAYIEQKIFEGRKFTFNEVDCSSGAVTTKLSGTFSTGERFLPNPDASEMVDQGMELTAIDLAADSGKTIYSGYALNDKWLYLADRAGPKDTMDGSSPDKRSYFVRVSRYLQKKE